MRRLYLPIAALAILVAIIVATAAVVPHPTPPANTAAIGHVRADGSTVAMIAGTSISAPAGSLEPGTNLSATVASSAPAIGEGRVIGGVVLITTSSQPVRPLIIRRSAPSGTSPSAVTALIWTDPAAPTVLPVALRDGELVTAVPHLSNFAFIGFDSVDSFARWLVSTLRDRYLSFLTNVSCASASASHLVRAAAATGKSRISITAEDTGAEAIAISLCNPTLHFMSYRMTGDITGPFGLVPPRGLSRLNVSLALAHAGSEIHVVASTDASAWTLTIAAIVLFAVPLPASYLQRLVTNELTSRDLNDLYDALAPAGACLTQVQVASSRSALELASDVANCISTTPAAARLQGLVTNILTDAAFSAAEAAAEANVLVSSLRAFSAATELGAVLLEIQSDGLTDRLEQPFVALADSATVAALKPSPASSPTIATSTPPQPAANARRVTVRGRVLSPDYPNGVPGVVVSARLSGPPFSAAQSNSDASGAYSLQVEAGTYLLEVEVFLSTQGYCDFFYQGRPQLPPIVNFASQPGVPFAISNDQPSFDLILPVGSARTENGRTVCSLPPAATASPTTTGAIAGSIRWYTSPLAGVKITVLQAVASWSTVTAADGSFLVTGLPAGAGYCVAGGASAVNSEYRDVYFCNYTVRGGETLQLGALLTAKHLGPIGPLGTIAGPSITFTWGSSSVAATYTLYVRDANGAFIRQLSLAATSYTTTLASGAYTWSVEAYSAFTPACSGTCQVASTDTTTFMVR